MVTHFEETSCNEHDSRRVTANMSRDISRQQNISSYAESAFHFLYEIVDQGQ